MYVCPMSIVPDRKCGMASLLIHAMPTLRSGSIISLDTRDLRLHKAPQSILRSRSKLKLIVISFNLIYCFLGSI